MSRLCLLILPTLVLLACNSGSGKLDDDDDDDDSGSGITDAEDIQEVCESGTPQTLQLLVEFAAPPPGCDWGEDGNLEREDLSIRARREQVDSLELPGNVVICDVEFDFEGVSGGEGTPMVFDDAFLFTFNDVVLVASQGSMLDVLEADPFYTYDWSAIRGGPLEFGEGIESYCIGEEEGLSDCEIPAPETSGIMSLSFEEEVIGELSLRAVLEERYDFSFITMGDNDDTDCYHEDFAFEVEVPYVEVGR